MNPSPTNSAIAAADEFRPCEQCGCDSPQGMRFCDRKCRALHEALAKLAAVEGEAVTSRLALALWMNGSTPNQPLIDDIERWRQEVAARVYQDEAVKASLTRAEQSEALLREADNRLRGLIRIVENELPSGACKDDTMFCERIQAHLAPKETT